jgi:hypothetical protein
MTNVESEESVASSLQALAVAQDVSARARSISHRSSASVLPSDLSRHRQRRAFAQHKLRRVPHSSGLMDALLQSH